MPRGRNVIGPPRTTQIYESRYKDQPALTVESGALTAQFLPHIGAKLCSLWVKRPALELLVQRPGSVYRRAPYGGDYVEQGECSGLDDMFPTIDRCFCDRYPWQGTEIPDHGEVWSIPWTAAVEGDRLHLAVDGVRFPYRLEKWISCAGDARLHIEYRLTNRAPFDFDFLWAAHPMFVLEEGAELTLPAGVGKVVTIFNSSGRLDLYNIFLEPATAPLDRPDIARLHGQQSTVRAGATYDWYLDIQVA